MPRLNQLNMNNWRTDEDQYHL